MLFRITYYRLGTPATCVQLSLKIAFAMNSLIISLPSPSIEIFVNCHEQEPITMGSCHKLISVLILILLSI